MYTYPCATEYARVFIHTQACIYLCVPHPLHTNVPGGCMYVYTEAYMQCDMCVYIHTYPFTHTHTTVYNRVYTCADMSTNTHIDLHIYTYANVKYKDLFQGRLRCRWMWRGCGCGVDLQLQLPFDPSLGTFVCGRCSPKKKKKAKRTAFISGNWLTRLWGR